MIQKGASAHTHEPTHSITQSGRAAARMTIAMTRIQLQISSRKSSIWPPLRANSFCERRLASALVAPSETSSCGRATASTTMPETP